MLLHLNSCFASYHDFPQRMTRILKMLGELSHHDKVHIIEVHNNMTYTILYEWSGEQCHPVPEPWKHTTIFYEDSLQQQLCKQNYIIVRDPQRYSDSRVLSLFEALDCRQMLVLPLFESNSQFAFISFIQCKQEHEWSQEELRILTDLSSVVATQLNNYSLIRRLVRQLRHLKQERQAEDILHTRLKKLHTELLPVWNQIRDTIPELQEKIPAISDLERYMTTLDRICNNLSDKS